MEHSQAESKVPAHRARPSSPDGREAGSACHRGSRMTPLGSMETCYHQESSAQMSQGQMHGSRTPPPTHPTAPAAAAHGLGPTLPGENSPCCLPPSPFLQPERRFLKQRSLKKLESHPKSKRVLKTPGKPETRKGHHRGCAPGHVSPLACAPADWATGGFQNQSSSSVHQPTTQGVAGPPSGEAPSLP